jgi:hypothetical protein
MARCLAALALKPVGGESWCTQGYLRDAYSKIKNYVRRHSSRPGTQNDVQNSMESHGNVQNSAEVYEVYLK